MLSKEYVRALLLASLDGRLAHIGFVSLCRSPKQVFFSLVALINCLMSWFESIVE
jgi:hypothetical protein